MAKYFKEQELLTYIGQVDLPAGFSVMSQDSYNEELIGAAIKKTGKIKELLAAAINVAVIGMGNKRYGSYRTDTEIVDISMLLTGCGIKQRLTQGALLKEDELTMQRLCRFFRYHIRLWLVNNKQQTFLYRKYSKHQPEMNCIMFRGAEYLDDLTAEQSLALRSAYEELDRKLNTTFVERFDRIRVAQQGANLII